MTRTIKLDGHFDVFVAAKVKEGRFDSADDVVRAGLLLLEDQELRLSALRVALIDGENSGPATAFDIDEFLTSMRDPMLPR